MLDRLLRWVGFVRLSKYNKMEEAYQHTRDARNFYKRKYEETLARNHEFERKVKDADIEGKARYTSPDGKRVLKDLQRALNYLRDYQRAMWVVLAPDNNFYLVKELLESWGMKPHSEVTDTYARNVPGVPKVDRTNQEYDSYGVYFIHDDNKVRTYEDIDPDDPKWKTDLTVSKGTAS